MVSAQNLDFNSSESSSESPKSSKNVFNLIENKQTKNIQPETTIFIEEPQDLSSSQSSTNPSPYPKINNDLNPLSNNTTLLLPTRSSSRDTSREIQSRLSFIVKEKLHEYAKDLRRRTSQA